MTTKPGAHHKHTRQQRAKRELADDYLYHGGQVARHCDKYFDRVGITYSTQWADLRNGKRTINRISGSWEQGQQFRRWVRYEQSTAPVPTRTFHHPEPLERVVNDARAVIDRLKAAGLLRFANDPPPDGNPTP